MPLGEGLGDDPECIFVITVVYMTQLLLAEFFDLKKFNPSIHYQADLLSTLNNLLELH